MNTDTKTPRKPMTLLSDILSGNTTPIEEGCSGQPIADPLDRPVNEMSIALGCMVPNENPTIQQPYRIAVIGDMPSADDEVQGKPFMGAAGRVLNTFLTQAKLLRQACFIGNIKQSRSGTVETDQTHLDQLTRELHEFNPHVCLLLGSTSLAAAKDYASIGNWRGSIFISTKPGPFNGRKCIASYHPQWCFKMYECMPLLRMDVHKAAQEALSPEFTLPIRNREINLTSTEIVLRLNNLISAGATVSIDIEGGLQSMSCISIASSEQDSFIIPFTNKSGDNYWENIDDELAIWSALANLLASPRSKKILQNCLYDRFVLQYSYSLIVINTGDDTMLKAWEKYCELEKGLGFLCSIYTKEPYYKSDRKSDDLETHWRYCCTDSLVTMEIANKLERMLTNPKADPKAYAHYRFNLEMLHPLLYMELRGIKYNSTLAKERLIEVQDHVYTFQYVLDDLSGSGARYDLAADTKENRLALLEQCRDVMCYKRDRARPKAGFVFDYAKVLAILLSDAPLTKANLGFISIAAKLSMNMRSPKFKEWIYDKLELPRQTKTKKSVEGEETTADCSDYAALLSILKKVPDSKPIETALRLGLLRTRAQMLAIFADPDGRIRCGYNVVGTETGRLTCYTSPTGSGYNLQTIPSDSPTEPEDSPLREGMRDLFVADEGYYIFQCDLSGADGWTVAANLASLGDRTMLDDYLAGIKPAKVLCYLLRHGAGSLAGKSREEIKQLTKPISSKDWDYFLCKIGQHGTSYLMGPKLLAHQVFIQSEGRQSITVIQAEELQRLFSVRYRVRLWHNSTQMKLNKLPVINSASGFSRRFFGRKGEILGQALAHEPQANTTYATNLAAWKLWNDKENRIASTTGHCKLRIEPLHSVHDALLGQFRKEDTAWAVNKIKAYFDNEIIIAGIPITIPFEGAYGESWGNLKAGVIA